MKYFFDIDASMFNHLLFVIIVLLGSVKVIASMITGHLHDGLLTVKDDAMFLREEVASYKERFQNGQLQDAFISNVRSFRENMATIDMRNWRLK